MGLVHHCGRGSQYPSIKYTERLAEAGRDHLLVTGVKPISEFVDDLLKGK